MKTPELDALINRHLATDAVAQHLTAVEQARAAVLEAAARCHQCFDEHSQTVLLDRVSEWMELRKRPA